VLTRGDSEPLVATGGADGKIVISGKITGSPGSGSYEDMDLTLTFGEVLQSLPKPNSVLQTKNTKHTFQRYAFLSDEVMATTACGRLFLATMRDPLVWEEVAVPEAIVADLKPYNVIKSPARNTAVLGSASGKVYLFRNGEVREIASLPEKVSDIILLDNSPNRTLSDHPWSVLINILGLDHAVLLHFDPSTDTSTMDPRKIRLPEHYIVTATTFCSNRLILGSRTGSLTVYSADTDTGDFVPAVSRKDCKTKDAITCIVPIPGTTHQSSFLTTCRDGKYRIYGLSSTPSADLNLQHEISPPLNTLETAFFTTPSPTSPTGNPRERSELILQGFHGANFITYNDSTGSILSSTPCGGAHRAFATVSCPHNPGRMRFVFSKASELRVVSQSAEGEKVLRAGGHGREIKSVASSYFSTPPSPTSPPGSDDGPTTSTTTGTEILVATAAEDTSIRIWRHPNHPMNTVSSNPPPNDRMDCLAIVQGHSAGIQTLRFFSPSSTAPTSSDTSARPTYLLSSAGSEELFLWRISRIDSPVYDALAVVREAVWDDRSADRDLRILDFDVASWSRDRDQGRGEGHHDADDGGKEGRRQEGEDGEEGILITMVLSDSSVRSYVYFPPSSSPSNNNKDTRKGETVALPGPGSSSAFKLVASGRYTGACPTQVRHLTTDPSSGTVDALTAFTDGHVAVWRTRAGTLGEESRDFQLALVVQLHQSSIKSLDLSHASPPSPSPSKGWFVATGGDDNALGFLDLTWDEAKREYAVQRRYRVRSAHAAAVTGLSVIRDAAPGITELATVSNDQRVKLWRVERSGSAAGGIRVAMLDNRYSSVADAGDLELIAPGKLMVGGVGMEVWDVSETK
jgi:hypothetical protein